MRDEACDFLSLQCHENIRLVTNFIFLVKVLVELLRLVLAIQDKSLDSLPLPHLCAIHAVLAIIMSIIVPISVLRDPLLDHVQSVINTRREKAPYLLPEVAFNRKNTQETTVRSSFKISSIGTRLVTEGSVEPFETCSIRVYSLRLMPSKLIITSVASACCGTYLHMGFKCSLTVDRRRSSLCSYSSSVN
nr:hypothetical protein HmN_000608800 [Hymenolepis microstoma]